MEKRDLSIDRRTWGYGPWDGEPDEVEWRVGGRPCRVRRTDIGVLCGYVGVSHGHPWYRLGYNHIDARCHGGLTFSDFSPGKSDEIWWVGFDCAHMLDLCPGLTQFRSHDGAIYRDLAYVKKEVERLAAQADDAAAFGD